MVLLHSSARGTSFHPVVLTYLLAGAQSGQLLLRLGDLDAIKDDDRNDDDQNGDDHHNHHLVIKPPRALVISLKRVQLLLLKEISTPYENVNL